MSDCLYCDAGLFRRADGTHDSGAGSRGLMCTNLPAAPAPDTEPREREPEDPQLTRLIGQTAARFGFGSPPPLKSMWASGSLHAMETLRDFLVEASAIQPRAADSPTTEPRGFDEREHQAVLDAVGEWNDNYLTNNELVEKLRSALRSAGDAAPDTEPQPGVSADGKTIDLMEALKHSLARRSPGDAAPTEPNPLDILALARIAAKRHHYALAVHGSMARDLDLIAVPWTDEATDPAVMVEAVRKAVGGWIFVAEPDGREGYYGINDESKHSPHERPHGRQAWSIYNVLGGAYLDLSVVSSRAAPDAARLREALREALAVIVDYLSYRHDGDPDLEDARLMQEMEINDYGRDGRLERARKALAGGSSSQEGEPPA